MDRLLLFLGLLSPHSRKIKYWVQTQNIACLRLVLKRKDARVCRVVLRYLRTRSSMVRQLQSAILPLLAHHSMDLAQDTASFLQTTLSHYVSDPIIAEHLVEFEERKRRHENVADTHRQFKAQHKKQPLIDNKKLNKLKWARKQFNKQINFK